MDELEEMYQEASKWTEGVLSEASITTDENKINEFKEIIQELCTLANKHNNSMDDFVCLTEENIKRTEFGIQSYCLHRGYYCPSPIYDLIVGGTKRGKLIIKPRKNTKDYYRYCFDGKNRLISVEQYVKDFSLYDIEYIIRKGDTEYGMIFHNHEKEISYMSKTEYENGLIKSYSGECYAFGNMDSLHHEKYFYTGSLLTEAIVYFNIIPKSNCYTKNKYTFKYDDNGKICGYVDVSD